MTARFAAHRTLALLIAALCVLPAGAVIRAGRARQAAPTPEDQAKQIVMVRGKIADSDVIGAGIIFGIDQDRIYVATANHVVRQGTRAATDVQVLLKWLPGEWTPARLLADFDADVDLAVLAIPNARSLLLTQKLSLDRLASEVKRLDQVFTIGYPAGQQWFQRVTPDIVAEATSDSVAFETSYLQPGHSGGALVNNKYEIVGLIKRDQPPNGVAIRIDRLVQQLRQWGYTVNLTARVAAPGSDSTRGSGAGPGGSAAPRGVPPSDPRSGPSVDPLPPLVLRSKAEWPMFGYDELHSNWNRYETILRPPLKLLRTISVSGLSVDALSATQGRLFAGGMSEKDKHNLVAAIDTASGRTEWTFALAGTGAMNVTPTYFGGQLVFGGQGDDSVYSVDPPSGKTYWMNKGVASLYSQHPLVRGNLLYYLTPDALVAADGKGQVVWRYPIRAIQTSPVGAGPLLAVLGQGRTKDTAVLHVIGSRGDPVSTFAVPAAPLTYPVAWQQQSGKLTWMVFVGTSQEVRAYPIYGGAPHWTTGLPGDSSFSSVHLAMGDGVLVAGLWKTTLNGLGFLYAIDGASGKTMWRFGLGGEGVRGPIIANGVVYAAGSQSRKIFALDVKSGKELWSADLPGAPTADPLVAYGLLFVPVGSTIVVFGA